MQKVRTHLEENHRNLTWSQVFFFSAAPGNLSWVIAPKKSIYYSDAWLRSCSTVADIREARTIWQSALCSYKHVSVPKFAWIFFFVYSKFRKLIVEERNYLQISRSCLTGKKQQVYGPMAFSGCLPRAAQSSYLTRDHHPVGTEPASGRGISRGRALYRRHIVLDCLRCQWERGAAS